jgi:hypothetical protein
LPVGPTAEHGFMPPRGNSRVPDKANCTDPVGQGGRDSAGRGAVRPANPREVARAPERASALTSGNPGPQPAIGGRGRSGYTWPRHCGDPPMTALRVDEARLGDPLETQSRLRKSHDRPRTVAMAEPGSSSSHCAEGRVSLGGCPLRGRSGSGRSSLTGTPEFHQTRMESLQRILSAADSPRAHHRYQADNAYSRN